MFFCLIVGVDVSILLDFVSWICFWIEWFTYPPVIRHSNVNGNVRILKWRYRICGDILLHRPSYSLIYGRYLQFGFLEWPLTMGDLHK